MISLKKDRKRKCLNCEKEPCDEKTKERLCLSCLRKLNRGSCFCCQKSFHVLSKAASLPLDQQLCTKCSSDKETFGDPSRCTICDNLCAFEGATCRTCTKSQKSFGAPVPCEKCSKLCAFNLSEKSKAKVGGRTLCYVCTQAVKLETKKEAKSSKREKHPSTTHSELSEKVHVQEKRSSSTKEVLLEPIAMSTTTEDTHWEVLTEKFEILQRTFVEHKEQSEMQIQQYIRKIFELRKELSEAQEAKDRAITKMHEKEREVGTLTGTVRQLENMAGIAQDQAKSLRIELEQKHAREVADLMKKIKFLEYVTPQKAVQEAKLTEEKNSSAVVKGPDSFFGAPVALGSSIERSAKRIRPNAVAGGPADKPADEPVEKPKKKKADAVKTETGGKSKLSKEDKKLRKESKKERKRLKKEAKRQKLEGVPEGNEDAEADAVAAEDEEAAPKENGHEEETKEAQETTPAEETSSENASSEKTEAGVSENTPSESTPSEKTSETPSEETAA